jgi:hypothetical protein
MSPRYRRGTGFCSECFEPRDCGNGAPERMLKCSHCGVRTLHIVSGMDNPNAPYDYGAPRKAPALDPEAVIMSAGLRPVYVENLGRDAWLLEEPEIVLIDADLDPGGMALVVVEILRRKGLQR